MRNTSPLLLIALALTLVATPASAQATGSPTPLLDSIAAATLVEASEVPPDTTHSDAAGQEASQPLHAGAVEHSAAFETRTRIHRYASFATLPLFAAEVALGQSLYNNSGANSDSKRGLHAAVGSGIVGLFAVNTVTGGWNLFGEGRRDTVGRKRRLLHGLLMMAADIGFLATTAAAPEGEEDRLGQTDRSGAKRHRNLAIASFSVGTAGYLTMLFGNR